MSNISNSSELQPSEIDPRLTSVLESLRVIQPGYERITTKLRGKLGHVNRGCGPSAFTLAKFVADGEGGIPLSALLDSAEDTSHGIRVIFGLQRERGSWIDHTWVEYTRGSQTLLVSPVSEKTSPRASFQATVVNSRMLPLVYERIGLSRFNSTQHVVKSEDVAKAKGVIDEINEGRIPEMYKDWYEAVNAELGR